MAIVDYVKSIGSGAASGAAAGSVAGPWGTVIGGVVGGLAGGVSQGQQEKALQEEENRLRKQNYMANQMTAQNGAVIGNNYLSGGNVPNNRESSLYDNIMGLDQRLGLGNLQQGTPNQYLSTLEEETLTDDQVANLGNEDLRGQKVGPLFDNVMGFEQASFNVEDTLSRSLPEKKSITNNDIDLGVEPELGKQVDPNEFNLSKNLGGGNVPKPPDQPVESNSLMDAYQKAGTLNKIGGAIQIGTNVASLINEFTRKPSEDYKAQFTKTETPDLGTEEQKRSMEESINEQVSGMKREMSTMGVDPNVIAGITAKVKNTGNLQTAATIRDILNREAMLKARINSMDNRRKDNIANQESIFNIQKQTQENIQSGQIVSQSMNNIAQGLLAQGQSELVNKQMVSDRIDQIQSYRTQLRSSGGYLDQGTLELLDELKQQEENYKKLLNA